MKLQARLSQIQAQTTFEYLIDRGMPQQDAIAIIRYMDAMYRRVN